jgi:hypothetical protein
MNSSLVGEEKGRGVTVSASTRRNRKEMAFREGVWPQELPA